MASYVVYCPQILPPNQPLLTIPIVEAAMFSTKPLKWIMFAVFTVLGSEGQLAEYDLGSYKASDVPLDLEQLAPLERNLLFIPTQKIRFVDIDGLNDKVSSNTFPESRLGFNNRVTTRDQGRSVVTEFPAPRYTQVAHLIPHSKGSKYLQTVCRQRNPDAEITNTLCIDDLINGIVVDVAVHTLMTNQSFAVIVTPNFALGVDEVLPPHGQAPAPPRRFTAHPFLDDLRDDLKQVFWRTYAQDLRHPQQIIKNWPVDWPPSYLWDFIYGVTVANKYGDAVAMDHLSRQVKSTYYSKGITTASDRAEEQRLRDRIEKADQKEVQRKAREERARKRAP